MAQRDPIPPIPPVTPPPTDDGLHAEPEVIADKGRYVAKVTTPFVDEFHGHYPTPDSDETPLTVTRAGVQVTKPTAEHLRAQAAQLGVEISIEKVGA